VQGAAFELIVGAQLLPELKELSAQVRGHEVDAVLRDGSLVEMKFRSSSKTGLSRRAFAKAMHQLDARTSAAGGKPAVLITNTSLTDNQLQRFRERFGTRSRVLLSTEAGLVSQHVSGGQLRPRAPGYHHAQRRWAPDAAQDASPRR
jgi:hypothetical protein